MQIEAKTPAAAADGASLVDGAHLDAFVIPEDDEASQDADAPQEVGENGEIIPSEEYSPERLDQAAFYTTLKTLVSVPAMYDAAFAPVAIQPQEEDQARAASDAIYALLVIWYPNALQPNSKTIGHLLVAVPFIAGKVMIVRAVLAEKRAKVVSPPNEGEEVTMPPPEAHTAPQRVQQPMGAI